MEMNINLVSDDVQLDNDKQVQILKGLAHPGRIAILDILRDGEHCVCHIQAHLGFRQAYISQQLMALRDAGLIQDRRDARNIYYRLADERLIEVLNIVRTISGDEEQSIRTPLTQCPCPKCNPLG
jgi:DNA-binding transcriptional ArsR family regulator